MASAAPDKVLAAIRRPLSGEIYLSESEPSRALASLSQGFRRAALKSPVELLSDRELEVLRSLGQGSSIREIAERLHQLSIKTVETHCARIKTKLNIHNSR